HVGDRFVELVLKQGVPTIFYEGSETRPRQTLLLRHAQEDQANRFRSQVISLMASSSGYATLRSLPSHETESDETSAPAAPDRRRAHFKQPFWTKIRSLFKTSAS